MARSSTSGKNPPPPGRPKGSKNKFSSDIKQMVIEAINKRGGVEFFAKLDDQTLARVAAKLVPQEIKADVKNEGNITVKIISSGEGKPA